MDKQFKYFPHLPHYDCPVSRLLSQFLPATVDLELL